MRLESMALLMLLSFSILAPLPFMFLVDANGGQVKSISLYITTCGPGLTGLPCG